MDTACRFYCLVSIIVVVILLEDNSFIACEKPGRTWHLQNVSDLLDNILTPEKGYQKEIRPGHGTTKKRKLLQPDAIPSVFRTAYVPVTPPLAPLAAIRPSAVTVATGITMGTAGITCPLGPSQPSTSGGQHLVQVGPTEVNVDLYVKSMGPISEEKMVYSMDCYFRQTWVDRRLRFKPLDTDMKTLKMDFKMLQHMWKPDTYVLNGRGSYLHTVTYPNKLLRLHTDGKIVYSQRLTIMATCPMDLRKYPMDNQTCPLLIGSYAYGHEEVVYKWKKGPKKSLDYSKDLKMAQFELIDWMGFDTHVPRPTVGNASVVVMNFMLTRSIGYCVLQTYLPLYMIVVISWVGFWINREATPARVTLGITTILTTSTIKGVAIVGLPQLSYNTALDYFLHLSFFFVFASLVEFAGVNYFTKAASAVKMTEEEPEEQEQTTANSPLMPTQAGNNGQRRFFNGRTNFLRFTKNGEECCCESFFHCLRGNSKYRSFKSRSRYMDGVNSVSKIDKTSRVVFPVSFLIINAFYWIMYLYYL